MSYKYIVVCILILIVSNCILANTRDDFEFITVKVAKPVPVEQHLLDKPVNSDAFDVVDQTKVIFYGLLYVYQHYISSQTEPSCMFNPSCSQFTKLSIQKYGLKGVIMGSDRVQRCNGLGALYYAKPAPEDKIYDPVEDYHY